MSGDCVVAKIRLSCIRRPLSIIDRHGAIITVDRVRIFSLVLLGAEANRAVQDCIIDSASELNVFPKKVWERIEDQIEWLTDHSQASSLRVAGGIFPFRYGRINAVAIQPDLKQKLPAVSILGQFLEDNRQLDYALLGLSNGILHRRKLTIDVDGNDVWLEETTNVESPASGEGQV